MAQPITYTKIFSGQRGGDFPVQSGNETQARSHGNASRTLEAALGCRYDEFSLYEEAGKAQQTALGFALKPLLCWGVMEKKVGMENPSPPPVG